MADPHWQLLGFMDALREWMRRDPPPGPLLVKATEFGAVLEQDPAGGDAEQEHANQFFRTMPGTEHDGRIVAISFSLEGRAGSPRGKQVRCQDIGCVPHPQQHLFLDWPPKPHH